MESSKNGFKALKDTLLEYATLNIDLLFLKQDSNMCAVPTFPNYLFEEVLEKSKDMCWSICREDLIPCVEARHRLKWSETNCFRFVDEFRVENQELFAESIHTLKTLKMSILLSELTDINFFNELSVNLEELELTINLTSTFIKNFLTPYGTYSKKTKNKSGTCTPLKLKRLRLNLYYNSVELFPNALDSGKLTVLELRSCCLTESFLRKLVCFKQLTYLSFYDSWVEVHHFMGNVIDIVVSMKRLRFLNLCIRGMLIGAMILNKIIEEIENLDILELREIEINEVNRLITPKKKLKVLNYKYLSVRDLRVEMALTGLAERIGHYENLEGLMTIISTTPSLDFYYRAVCKLYDLINKAGLDLNVLVEAEKNEIFNFRSPKRLTEKFHSMQRTNKFYDLTLRLICYGSLFGMFYSNVNDWMRHFIEHNENTHLANKFKSLL